MADKAIQELIAAEQITPTGMFVLEQNGTAKKLMGQTLLNWLTAAADGHGGIQSIQKTGTQGLVDTYTITLADLTTYDIPVTNGKGVTSFSQTGTAGLVDTYTMVFTDGSQVSVPVTNGKAISSVTLTGTVGLVDTYTIAFNDGTTQTFSVRNGEKGDPGDNAYVHIKWASQNPENPPHSMGNVPDNWMGIHTGNTPEAPEDYTQYDWFEVKGEKGDTGAAAQLTSKAVEYQASTSGTVYPSGAWSTTIPTVPAGQYLWTRTTLTFNSGSPIVSYSVGRMGIDGTGAVSAVNNVSPDENGNVTLTAQNVGALPTAGGTMSGHINMNGNQITGLNPPTKTDQPATMGYVDGQAKHFADVTVAAASFVAFTDTQLNGAGYGYRAAVALEGVTASMMPIVVLSEEQVESGLFGATADSHLGGVYIYAKRVPDAAVTIPLITLWHSGGPHGITNAGMKQPVVVNPNLLDNWYFGNPVNQRGASSTTAWNYFIDRWLCSVDASIAFTDECLTLAFSGTDDVHVYQPIDNGANLYNKEVTISVLCADGELVSSTCILPSTIPSDGWTTYCETTGEYIGVMVFASWGNLNCSILKSKTKTEVKLVAAKLELGDTQTLAHQDANGNWVLNEIPDYWEQLARCQVKAIEFNTRQKNDGFKYCLAVAISTTQARAIISTPVRMRAVPAITFHNVGLWDGTNRHEVTDIKSYELQAGSTAFNITSSNLTTGKVYVLTEYASDQYSNIFASADL